MPSDTRENRTGARPQARAHRIVIVGGGAGGLELATRLGDQLGARGLASVTLVDRVPTHVWKPLLHEVAAGSMDQYAHQLEFAAQASWHHFEFQLGALSGLDRRARTITVAASQDAEGIELLPTRTIAYETLVLAIGSVTNFFGVPGAAEHAIALDTVAEAERFRRRMISACMRAQGGSLHPGAPTREVGIAIIGAGATGVELSAELRNTAHVLRAYGLHDLDPRRDVRIHLIESGPRILPALSERVAAKVAALLGTLDVDLLTGERVVEVGAECVRTASGRTITADLTVWAAGITAPAVLRDLDGLAVNRQGQVLVGLTLQSETDPDVFAFGDCASCPWAGQDSVVPPRAQAAHQQADFLFHALQRRLAGKPLPEFRFRDFGSLVSIGHTGAAGSLMGGLIHAVGGALFVEGWVARIMYISLYRMHLRALHGWVRMLLDTVVHWLRSKTHPRVKLH